MKTLLVFVKPYGRTILARTTRFMPLRLLLRNIRQILPFGFIWLVLGWVFLLVEYAAADGPEAYRDTAISLTPEVFIFASIAVFVVGLLIGFVEIRFLQKAFANQSFLQKVFFKLIVYSLLLFIIITITFPIAASLEMSLSVLQADVWNRYLAYLYSTTFLSTGLQMAVSLLLTIFYAEIRDYVGQGVLRNFFMGKYHHPIEETRIFMFLDMKSSTAIAERLGHRHYFKLLRQFYIDLSKAAKPFDPTVYQYVGDEMVLTWVYRNKRTVQIATDCYFEMKEALHNNLLWYDKHFGEKPCFKAGIHMGRVTTGEIGVLKKELLFTGDVLNVTSRIQALCNSFEVSILVSKTIAEEMIKAENFKFLSKGEVKLKGKEEKVELFTVKRA
ncbi:adenylate/guanylate cyclase domain-containing protein [Luteirhabdus pelagi]|uniref:adenylate/guanylate cyclase domain-containing protein n=1 Tax=Luteirhabdus pelagi TaxID=2792783 RepID=UPI00193ADD07|nr:adenylate/guanylate cyclase domain-containing protein [Luteirhabdus pelagi]